MDRRYTNAYVLQADCDRHGHLVQDTGDAANGSRQTDGPASKGHQANEQGIGIHIGKGTSIGFCIRYVFKYVPVWLRGGGV